MHISIPFSLLALSSLPAALATTTSTIPISQHGFCGPWVKRTCTGSKFGPSCAWFGVCGPQSNSLFSGRGCQSKYGVCGTPTKPSTPSSSSTSTTTTAATSTTSLPPGVTLVAIQNPSFESTVASQRKAKRSRIEGRELNSFSSTSLTNPLDARQNTAQTAASTAGWAITSCYGTSGLCVFENSDAYDGVWAFTANKGGYLQQDNVKLTIGATYSFTYWTKTTFLATDTPETTLTGVFLGNTQDTSANGYTVGQTINYISPNGPWTQQTFQTIVDCNVASNGVVNGDGTATFRLFIGGRSCFQGMPCYDTSNVDPNYQWLVDAIVVKQTVPAASVTTCP